MDKKLALEILVRYEEEHTYLNIALNNALKHPLNRNEKNRITLFVYGTMQHRLYLEYLLEPFIQGKKVQTYEHMLLLMCIYEHVYMSIPDYAIVNEAVEMCKREKGRRSASFVNAVLRNVFKNERSLEGLDEIQYLSITTSHPLWLVKMFIAQYGLDTSRKILNANNNVPLRTGRVNTLLISRDDFLKKYPMFEKGTLSKNSVILDKGSIGNTEAFRNGEVAIQDESSQLVAEYLDPQDGEEILDMCAAPGSKTTHIAALMHNTGHIDAYDLYQHKASLIKRSCERLKVTNVSLHVGDSTKLTENTTKQYDRILLDGPCTGYGVISRKPEIRYHDSSIMDEIIPIQKKLLDNAYAMCKNNGVIVYSTCTLNKKENEMQIKAFLEKYPDMHKVKDQTILPYEYHSDGFYMCLLKKGKDGIDI